MPAVWNDPDRNKEAGVSEQICVLIADDHNVVRSGLRALLDTEEGIQVVGEASDGVEAVAQARWATCSRIPQRRN